MPARLVTIGISHYCEKARWALDRAGWRYTEDRHVPILHYGASMVVARQRLVPILVLPHGRITDSTDILRFVDRDLDEGVRLFPHDDALCREVTELEEDFDRRLGPASRRYAYAHLLRDPRLFLESVSARTPRAERAAASVLRRPIAAIMRRGLRITAEGAARSLARLHETFDAIDARLRDGRRYLTGDRFTAADLAFASLSAPVLLVPEYPSPLPPLDAVPDAFASAVRGWRARPAGEFVLRLYRDERTRVVR
jgi:glutathione S-transferase